MMTNIRLGRGHGDIINVMKTSLATAIRSGMYPAIGANYLFPATLQRTLLSGRSVAAFSLSGRM